MSEDPPLLERLDDGVLILTLNRPRRLNALSEALRIGLTDALEAAAARDGVAGVVLTGAGDRAFSAGQDLDEAQAFTAATIGGHFRRLGRLYQAIRACPKPVGMALNGVTAGFGFQAALHADIRVAHAGVTLSQPEVRAGIPSVMGLWIIMESVGLPRAVELSLTCRAVPAAEMMAWGALDAVVPPDAVLDETLRRVRALAAKPRRAFAASKLNLTRLTQADYDATIEAAVRIQEAAFETGEPQRVAEAFLAARAARAR